MKRISAVPIETGQVFMGIEKFVLKFIWKCKYLRKVKVILKKNKAGRHTLAHIVFYFNSTETEIM